MKQLFTISKLLGFKNIESLVFEAFLSKTEKTVVFLQPLDYGSTYAAAESFNAKVKDFRRQFRGVVDEKFFLFRLTKIFA
ncbi:hypothetical protein [Saccharicrinis fermentans]|uniref:hypothetical protein n=1 Tax=Saccharicrinis fermentans TaxID=982 RepID=UPI001FD307A1